MYNLENCSIQTNDTNSINDTQQPSSYEKNKILFWCFATVCVIITIITIIGNGIVVIASHQTRNNNRLRHLDGVVKSLAVTDFLFGLFGAPLVALNYYLVGNDIITTSTYEEEMMKLIPNTLSTCNCLHVALLVYLRLIAVTKALKCKQIHRHHRKKTIVTMWIISLTICLFPPLTAKFNQKKIEVIFKHIILHVFHTIPIIFIVFIYSKLIYIVESKRKMKTKQRMSSNTLSRVNSNNKLSTSMVKGVVICLFVCYIPYLAWWQYSMVIYRVGGNRYINCKIVVKSGEMVFAAFSRILMLVNSTVNPFVYAVTIPAFKKFVKGYFLCNFKIKMEQPGPRSTYTFSSKSNVQSNNVNINNA